MSRRIIGWNPIGEHLGSEPILATDAAPPRLRGGDADPDDEIEREKALAEAVKRLARDSGLSPARASIVVSRAAIDHERDNRSGAADVVAPADADGRHTAARTARDVGDMDWPPGHVRSRSAITLERGRSVDHERDFAPIEAGGADDSLPREVRDVLLPAPGVRIEYSGDLAFDERVRRSNAEVSRRINGNINAWQQRPDVLAEIGA